LEKGKRGVNGGNLLTLNDYAEKRGIAGTPKGGKHRKNSIRQDHVGASWKEGKRRKTWESVSSHKERGGVE